MIFVSLYRWKCQRHILCNSVWLQNQIPLEDSDILSPKEAIIGINSIFQLAFSIESHIHHIEKEMNKFPRAFHVVFFSYNVG